MTVFILSAEVTVGAWTEVVADSLAEAIAISESRDVVLHSSHSGTDPSESWCIEEPDGMPMNITGEEA